MEPTQILPGGLHIPDRTNQIKWLKILGLAVFAILFFGVGWQLLSIGFAQNQGLIFWLWPGLAVGLGVAFLALLSVVNRSKILFLVTSLGLVTWYVLAFPKDKYIWISGGLFFLLTLWFERRIKHDEQARADFSLSRIMRDSISIMVYALLLVIGFNVFIKTNTEFQNNPKNFYNQIGHYAAAGLVYVPNGLGDFRPDQTFDDFVANQAQRQDPSFASVPEAAKFQVMAGVREQLISQFNIQVSGNPLLGDVVAGVVAEKVQQAAVSYQNFFPAIFAVIVAALLRTLAFVFIWLTMGLSWLIFQLLLLVRFFRIEKVQVEVNKLQI
jgi:hypothetical protein